MHYPNTIAFWSADEGRTIIEDMARQGLSCTEIAAKIGVKPHTLAGWRSKCPAIDAAILRGRDWCVAAVEQALLRRALGYTVEEITTEETGSSIKTKVSEKHIPGDLSAQLSWLRVHRADVWGEKSTGGKNGVVSEIVEAVKNLE